MMPAPKHCLALALAFGSSFLGMRFLQGGILDLVIILARVLIGMRALAEMVSSPRADMVSGAMCE